MNLRRAVIEDTQVLADFNINMAYQIERIKLIPEVTGTGVETMIKNPQMGFYLVAENQGEIAASLMVTTDWRNGLLWWKQRTNYTKNLNPISAIAKPEIIR